MARRVDSQTARRQPTQPAGGYKPADPVDPADVLARVYALILSWPTTEEKRKQSKGDDPT